MSCGPFIVPRLGGPSLPLVQGSYCNSTGRLRHDRASLPSYFPYTPHLAAALVSQWMSEVRLRCASLDLSNRDGTWAEVVSTNMKVSLNLTEKRAVRSKLTCFSQIVWLPEHREVKDYSMHHFSTYMFTVNHSQNGRC